MDTLYSALEDAPVSLVIGVPPALILGLGLLFARVHWGAMLGFILIVEILLRHNRKS